MIQKFSTLHEHKPLLEQPQLSGLSKIKPDLKTLLF